MDGRGPKAIVVVVVALLLAGCTPPDTTRPSPTPTASASTRPRFPLATYQYAIQAHGKLRVGTQEDNAPFSGKDPNTGEWSGFDVDVARELARAIFGEQDDPDTHIDWVPVNAATRVSALTGGTADVVLQTLPAGDETTQAAVDVSRPYFHATTRLLVRKDDDRIKEVTDLVDGAKTVCTQRGSASEQALRAATSNGAKVLLVDSFEACLQALQIGAAEAIAANEVVLASLAKTDATTTLVGASFGERRYGIGTKKNVNGDRQGFLPFLDEFVGRLVASGTWAALYEKDITPVTGDRKPAPD